MSTQTIAYSVETVNPDNVDEAISFCKEWYETSDFCKSTGYAYKPNRQFFLKNSSRITMLVGRDSAGDMRAIYVGILAPDYFCSDLIVLSTMAWSLDKEYRGHKSLVRLIQEIRLLARELGANIVALSSRLSLNKLGFRALDNKYYMEV